MFNLDTLRLAKTVLAACRWRGWHVATAESCTGGLVAAALTGIPGSSEVVECGFVTYSNNAKIVLLGVPAETIAKHGAISAQTAVAMAQGAVARAGAMSPYRSPGSPGRVAARRKGRLDWSSSASPARRVPLASSAASSPATVPKSAKWRWSKH